LIKLNHLALSSSNITGQKLSVCLCVGSTRVAQIIPAGRRVFSTVILHEDPYGLVFGPPWISLYCWRPSILTIIRDVHSAQVVYILCDQLVANSRCLD